MMGREDGAVEQGSARAKTLVENIHSAEITVENIHSAEITVWNIHSAEINIYSVEITGGETRLNWLLIAAQPN